MPTQTKSATNDLHVAKADINRDRKRIRRLRRWTQMKTKQKRPEVKSAKICAICGQTGSSYFAFNFSFLIFNSIP
jgi:hypothetical protein